MWDKIQDISILVLVGGFYLMLFIYVPIKCSMGIVERIKNSENEPTYLIAPVKI